MSTIGIVCEYNPFHKGHEYHIVKSRERVDVDAAVICVMSGDFVQRGEAAAFSKYARAEAACRCGADLVVELPLPWSVSSAERFAAAAVSLLSALKVDTISFGSESGELEPLVSTAQAILDEDFAHEVKAVMKQDASLSYPTARQIVLGRKTGEMAGIVSTPNNILSIEYIKAIITQNLDITPVTIKRFGSAHDEFGTEEFHSAADIRRTICQGGNYYELLPEKAAQVFKREAEQGRVIKSPDALDMAILSRLRMFRADYFETLPDASDGVGRRIHNAVRNEPTLEAVCAAAKTKRYTMSRIKRLCLCAALGVTSEMTAGLPRYARILSANAKGCEYLRRIGDEASVKLITKPASVKQLDRESNTIFARTADAHDLYVLGFSAEKERNGGNDWRTGPKIV